MGCGGEGSSHQFVLGPMGLAVTLYRGQWAATGSSSGEGCSQV